MFSLLAALRSQSICFEIIGYYEMKDRKTIFKYNGDVLKGANNEQ